MTAIPEIDLAGDPVQVAAAVLDAYAEVGFAYLVGHAVAHELVDAIFDASRRFHALPLDRPPTSTPADDHPRPPRRLRRARLTLA